MWFVEGSDSQIGRITLGGYQLRDTAGDTTTFTPEGSSGQYVPTFETQPGGANDTTIDYTSLGGQAVPFYAITAPPAIAPQTCVTNPQAGCRMLTFVYATQSNTTQTTDCAAGNSGQNVANQLEEVDFTAWDPSLNGGAGGMRGPGQTLQNPAVACYLYSSNGQLVGEWDPRTEQTYKDANQDLSTADGGLETTYSYTNSELTGLTPPGQNPWTFTYAGSASQSPLAPYLNSGATDPYYGGSLMSVSRTLGGVTSTSAVEYDVPTTTAAGGPYDFSTAANWGESDPPTSGTAIFPPDELQPRHHPLP
jgi:hypothetical protein